MAPRIAVVYYSTYGRMATLARTVADGVRAAGGEADIYRIDETLSDDILRRMHAPPKADDPVLQPEDLERYDAFLFGIPTRFGVPPAQWRAFWDKTGPLWVRGALHGKYAGTFVSTGTLGGGQEVTALNFLSSLTHHGILYVPLSYVPAFPQLTNFEEAHGGSPWGAGTLAGGDGSRGISKLELEIATSQGDAFYKIVSRVF